MMHWCRGPPFPVAANQRPERTGTLVNVKPAPLADRPARGTVAYLAYTERRSWAISCLPP